MMGVLLVVWVIWPILQVFFIREVVPMSDKGVVIGQACDILRMTYKEINRLKDDVAELLNDYDSSFGFFEEYSYGPKILFLKANHTFLFKVMPENDQNYLETTQKEKLLAIVCIFYEWNSINRINLKDQPEIWFVLLDVLNVDESMNVDDIHCLFDIRERTNFTNDLRVDGTVCNYHWLEEDEEVDPANLQEWIGKFIGFPLVSVSDKEFLKENVLDKLFSANVL